MKWCFYAHPRHSDAGPRRLMGHEYRLDLRSGSPDEWARVMRNTLDIDVIPGRLFDIGQRHAEGMPDAYVKVETDHVYFCVNGGSGARLLAHVERSLDLSFGIASREEL